MGSFANARMLVERIYKCIKGTSKADYRDFTSACIQLARMIDLAIAKRQKLSIVHELTLLLKKVCEQRDNEMFQPAIMVLLMSVKNAICFNWFTASEGQDVLRLTKDLLHFFTGVGGSSAVDSTEACQVISSLMPRFYPLLGLQTVVVALQAKAGYEAMVCDFYVLKKPAATEELRLFVIRMDNQDTSACLVTPSNVNFLVNGKAVEKRSLGSMEVGPQMPSNVTAMLKIGTNLLQIVGDFLGNYLIAIALTTSSKTVGSPLDLPLYMQSQAMTTAQADEELVVGRSRVSLLCPISHKRITSPVKGPLCKHNQCFDYSSFIEINSRRPSWRCPCCNQPLSFPDLRLDLQMLKILKETRDDDKDVMVFDDGSWETSNKDKSVSVHASSRNLNQGSEGEGVAEDGEVSSESGSEHYIDVSDDNEQESQDRSAISYSHPELAQFIDKKPDVRSLSVANDTPSADGRTGTPSADGRTQMPSVDGGRAGAWTDSLSFQVQLPSFVGIQDGQVLLSSELHSQLHQVFQEASTLSNDGQRLQPLLQQQRSTVTAAPTQFGNQRIDHLLSSLPGRSNAPVRAAEHQHVWGHGQASHQQSRLNLGQYGSNTYSEGHASPRLRMEGSAPLFRQSSQGTSLVSGVVGRQSSSNSRPVTPQNMQGAINSSLLPCTNAYDPVLSTSDVTGQSASGSELTWRQRMRAIGHASSQQDAQLRASVVCPLNEAASDVPSWSDIPSGQLECLTAGNRVNSLTSPLIMDFGSWAELQMENNPSQHTSTDT